MKKICRSRRFYPQLRARCQSRTHPNSQQLRSLAGLKFQIGALNPADVEEARIVRVPIAYPAYEGSYDRFDAMSADPEFTCPMRVIFLATKVSGRLTQRRSVTRRMEEIEVNSGGWFERALTGKINRVIKRGK